METEPPRISKAIGKYLIHTVSSHKWIVTGNTIHAIGADCIGTVGVEQWIERVYAQDGSVNGIGVLTVTGCTVPVGRIVGRPAVAY